MAPDVADFIAKCRRDAAALTPVKVLFKAFGDSLRDSSKRSAWSRSNFIMELARGGFTLGEFANADMVVGLAAPVGGWSVVNGKLTFAA